MEEMNREIEQTLDGILYNPERPLTELEKRTAAYYEALAPTSARLPDAGRRASIGPGERFEIQGVTAVTGGVEPAGAEQ